MSRQNQGIRGKHDQCIIAACSSVRSVPLNNVMKGIYEDCSKVKRSGHHGSKNPEEAVEIIVNDLLKGNIFEQQPGRSGYSSFAKFKSNILDVDYRDFFQWSKDRLREWKGICEVADH